MRIFTLAFFIFLPITSLRAQSVQSRSASAPTNFGTEQTIDNGDAILDVIQKGPSSYLQKAGPGSAFQTFSVRGLRAKEVGVQLEGIPLNSPASGDFDLGMMSSCGLQSLRIVRGSYSPLSTNGNGLLAFSLAQENKNKIHVGYGSYNSFNLGEDFSFGSVCIDQGDYDWPYSIAGKTKTRDHNFSQRVNARLWFRRENYQIWSQTLYNDIEVPGPTNFLSPHASSNTFNQTIAAQGRSGNWSGSFWWSGQRQEYTDPDFGSHSLNRSLSTGLRAQYGHALSETLRSESQFDATQDRLISQSTSARFNSPWRFAELATQSFFWEWHEGQLLHPYMKAEYLGDLDEGFAIHPGIGTRNQLGPVALLGNFAWVSRAPNFNELYFEIPGQSKANPLLRRQSSLQGDFGYEWATGVLSTKWRQAAFWNRTQELIQCYATKNIYQCHNSGTGLSFGLENEISLSPISTFDIQMSYSYQHASLGSERQIYQARHKLGTEFTLYPDYWMVLSLSIEMHSSVYAGPGQGTISPQYDFGLKAKAHFWRFELIGQLHNLLGRDLEAVKNYPLPNEPYGSINLSARL